ncbi:ribonucleoside-diphosphate reductase, adenosylcobalamin-dependent, partial [archaeon 13_2_20CM_2_53_6]
METHQIPTVPPGEYRYQRRYTKPGVHPYDTVKWELRDATITDHNGQIIFEQKKVETPSFWSQTATNIVASKYFRGRLGTNERERSIRQLLDRVAKTITRWGVKGRYFQDEDEPQTFEAELTHILLYQMAAFNSPVWFNVGVEERPQCSACFINSVKDDMRSIMQLAMTEGMLFKYGSGTGSNLSNLRSSKEHLSTGGKASGPVSFMKGYDAFAGVIKSGGRTRRAAKMVILNTDHPDIVEFIWSKANEEKKAWALIDAGYDGSVDGEAYGSVFFQNANHSVRVTDDFMHAVTDDKEWQTHYITNHKVADTYKAADLMRQMAEAAYICGDPGIQFDTTVNEWNPCSNTDRINASNPCSEYMFLDDSACNLASLNLMKFRTPDGELDVESFKHAVEIVITAQEILVDNASYPTPGIEKNSHDYRPLGIGYANLGALLMSLGIPYDSDKGRTYSAAISSLMSGHAYSTSSLVAKRLGPFRGYPSNEKPFLNVIGMHRSHAYKIPRGDVPRDLVDAAVKSWDEALSLGERFGFKNAQISVIAPTGTIAFMMDCDTTGIEPDIALVKYKWLVGGGVIKIVNNTVPEALKRL